ncbi:MOSC domain-containing protein [Paenibacillus sambharensis]|uniref:MOSC domain-containing protein n=1 Tax=Paenibacillus sambharensis TaxID=1803190 RepID=A0A2W1LF77_9BACL|nr:MOSC domain-containing protein [Paenibacillus sambharensis]PZD97483.1 MOSC domain-containing protein [Paenibacillus sambharensis]
MRTHIASIVSVMAASHKDYFVTTAAETIHVELGGIPGDRHFGIMVPADVRQNWYPRGTMIANRRQISIVSAEECEEIASKMGLPEVRAEWLGANILVSGFEGLTGLPRGSRLLFPDGTGLICEGENEPCTGPGLIIGEQYGRQELSRNFVKAAYKRRGIVCSVEREGTINRGDLFRILIPE